MLKTRKNIVLISGLLLVIAGIIDYFLAYEIASMLLYLIPVVLFSYQNKISLKFVIVFSLIVGAIWVLNDYGTHPYSNDIYLFWNSFTRVAIFVLVAITLKRIVVEKEHRLIISIQKQYLTEINADLQESNMKLNQFIGAAAHDIRNPVGNIISFSDLLIQYNLESIDQRYQLLHIINDSAKKALLILNDTLYLCQVNAGTLNLNKTANEYITFIKKCILLNEYMASAKKQSIQLITTVDSIGIEFDKARLEQVMTNLLTNAIKYSDFGTQIIVSLKFDENPNFFRTDIIDHGLGIDNAYKSELFQPFFTTPNFPTNHESKTGLGLAISKQIIELHNGTIDFTSKKGEGSDFYFTIPI